MRELKIRALLILRVPDKRFLVGDFLHIIHAEQPGPVLGLGDGLGIGNAFRGDESFHRAAHPDFFGQRARVDALDAWDAVLLKVVGQRDVRPPVAHDRGKFANDKPCNVRTP